MLIKSKKGNPDLPDARIEEMQAEMKVLSDRLKDQSESTLELTKKIYFNPRSDPKDLSELENLKIQNTEYMATIGQAFEVLKECQYIYPVRISDRAPYHMQGWRGGAPRLFLGGGRGGAPHQAEGWRGGGRGRETPFYLVACYGNPGGTPFSPEACYGNPGGTPFSLEACYGNSGGTLFFFGAPPYRGPVSGYWLI